MTDEHLQVFFVLCQNPQRLQDKHSSAETRITQLLTTKQANRCVVRLSHAHITLMLYWSCSGNGRYTNRSIKNTNLLKPSKTYHRGTLRPFNVRQARRFTYNSVTQTPPHGILCLTWNFDYEHVGSLWLLGTFQSACFNMDKTKCNQWTFHISWYEIWTYRADF